MQSKGKHASGFQDSEALCPVFVWAKQRLPFPRREPFFAVSLLPFGQGNDTALQPSTCGRLTWEGQSALVSCSTSDSCTHWERFLLTFLFPHFHINVPSPQLSVVTSVARALMLAQAEGGFCWHGFNWKQKKKSQLEKKLHPSLGTEIKHRQFLSVSA